MEYSSTISFPGLGIGEFTVSNVAFHIPGIEKPIMWYALFITFGMICCIIYTITQARKINITIDDVIDFALFTIPIGVIGARLYYVIFDTDPTHVYNDFIDVIDMTKGGLAIYGGIIAGTITVLLVSFFKKINFFAFGDCVAPGVLLAQGIGRWGNFMNGEAFGYETDSFIRMGLQNHIVDGYIRKGVLTDVQIGQTAYVHPTFLYESLWNLTGVLLVYLFAKFIKKKYDGQLILLIFGWYGLGRMFIEGLRTDSLTNKAEDIRVSQALAAVIFVVCLVLLIIFAIKKPTKPLYCKALAEGENKANEKVEFPIINKIREFFDSKKSNKIDDEKSENSETEE